MHNEIVPNIIAAIVTYKFISTLNGILISRSTVAYNDVSSPEHEMENMKHLLIAKQTFTPVGREHSNYDNNNNHMR